MARVPYYYEPETASEADKERYSKLQPMNIMRMMMHAGPMLDAFLAFSVPLFSTTELSPVLRQLAILRVAYKANTAYTQHHHSRIARAVGVTEEQIAAVFTDPPRLTSDIEKRLIAFTDEVILKAKPSDATFEALAAMLPVRQLQELVFVIGYYMMATRFLNTFEVDMDPNEVVVKTPTES